jgi:hypothetical protein
LASAADFAAAVPQLCGLAKALRAEVGVDSLLLHIDAASGKVRWYGIGPAPPIKHCCIVSMLILGFGALQLVLKRYGASAPSSAAGLKPVEMRVAAVQSAFQMLQCSTDIDMTAPVPKARALEAGVQ